MGRYVASGYWEAGYVLESDDPAGLVMAWDNKADGATITAIGSEKATLPATNVQQPHLSRKWHTLAGVKSSYIVLDALEQVFCSCLALLGTNLTPSATLRLRASQTDLEAISNLVLDTTDIAAGVKSGYDASYTLFDGKLARYWRLDIADDSLADNLQVGRLFLGPSWTHHQTLQYGWGVTPLDESAVVESYGGQSFPEVRPKRRVLDFVLDYLSESEAFNNPFKMARDNGVVTDVLAIPIEDGEFVSEQAVWGLCQAHKPVIHRLSKTFRQQFTVRERL